MSRLGKGSNNCVEILDKKPRSFPSLHNFKIQQPVDSDHPFQLLLTLSFINLIIKYFRFIYRNRKIPSFATRIFKYFIS